MANIKGIEVSGETYDIEDSSAREGVQTNATDIDDIQAVVPASASSSNKLTTQSDLPSISTRIVALGAGTSITVNAQSEGNPISSAVTLDEGEVPVGITYLDGAYGGGAEQLAIKGFRINFNSTTREASVTAFVGNISDSALTVSCNASIAVMKIS